MSFSSRPASSPGRTENPALLMRFLRTTAGSRSRHRSRSRPRSKRPIFFRRKNATETQEPSSPKVTCMGQVRINRSKKKPKPGTNRVNGGHLHGGGATESRRRRRCGWVKNAFSCHPFSGKLKPTCFTPAWRKWKSFTNVSFSRKSEKRSSSSRSEPIFSRSTVEPEEVQKKERKQEEEGEADSDKSFPTTPPRNAFLLTRCRSAPYRSPSLGDNFLVEEEETKESHFQRHGNDVIASPDDVSVSSVTEEVKRCVLGSPRRLCMVLTRCKSEPARVGEKLVPENPRLGYT
ncbi:Protamine P1 family protein [Hirschfeldia incana]|nr:Protamine P1 family protein [Hirschfeldia incana]